MLSYLSAIALIGATGFLADAGGFDYAPLINMGAVGIVLAWFLWKDEPRKRAIEGAIDRNNRTILLLLLEIQETTPRGRAMAEGIIKEIDKAEAEREK